MGLIAHTLLAQERDKANVRIKTNLGWLELPCPTFVDVCVNLDIAHKRSGCSEYAYCGPLFIDSVHWLYCQTPLRLVFNERQIL
jgi:hypothetical protein